MVPLPRRAAGTRTPSSAPARAAPRPKRAAWRRRQARCGRARTAARRRACSRPGAGCAFALTAAAAAAQPFDSTARCAPARAPGALPPLCRAALPRFDAATLSHRWPCAKPQPGAFLRKNTGPASGSGSSGSSGIIVAPLPAQQCAGVAPPKSGAWARRDNPPNTHFRRMYERGDVPACVDHGSVNTLRWRGDVGSVPPEALLPLFLDGVRETEDPYRFIAVRGSEELLAAAGERALPALPALVQPLRRALITRDRSVVATAALLLQALLRSVPGAGEALVPHYAQLLPTLRLYARGAPCAGDGHSFGQRLRGARNLPTIVDETLLLMHQHGGPGALAAITKFVPTFQTCRG
jgi:hypothetical protein